VTVDEEKKRMRDHGRLIRQEAAGRNTKVFADRAKKNFLNGLSDMNILANSVFAGYWPLPGEVDIRPLLEGLDAQGHVLALPVVVEEGHRLAFRRWRPGLKLEGGLHGTLHPGSGEEEVRPDVVFIPLISFDLSGYRLGQGGGYYDRTLESLRAGGDLLAVGFAWEAQRVDAVPRNAYDQRLDWIITEENAHGIS